MGVWVGVGSLDLHQHPRSQLSYKIGCTKWMPHQSKQIFIKVIQTHRDWCLWSRNEKWIHLYILSFRKLILISEYTARNQSQLIHRILIFKFRMDFENIQMENIFRTFHQLNQRFVNLIYKTGIGKITFSGFSKN